MQEDGNRLGDILSLEKERGHISEWDHTHWIE